MKNKTNLLKQKEAYLKMKDAENVIALPGEDNCRIRAKKRGGSYAYKNYLKSLREEYKDKYTAKEIKLIAKIGLDKFEQMKKGA